MRKYVKNNNNLLERQTKIKIFDTISDIPSNLSGEIIIVKNIGIFLSNNANNTILVGGVPTPRNIGDIISFYGNTIPNGWLECDGSTFSSSMYSELYNFLGTNVLPDYRECVLRGGTTPGSFSDFSLRDHGHSYNETPHTHSICVQSHCHTFYFINGATCCMPNDWSTPVATGYASTNTNSGLIGQQPTFTCVPSGVQITTVDDSSIIDNVVRDNEVGVRFIIYTGV